MVPCRSASCFSKDFYFATDRSFVSSFERKFTAVSSVFLSCTKPTMLSAPFHVSGMHYGNPSSFHMRDHKPSNNVFSFILCLLLAEQMKHTLHLVKGYSCFGCLANSTAGPFPAVLREALIHPLSLPHLLIFLKIYRSVIPFRSLLLCGMHLLPNYNKGFCKSKRIEREMELISLGKWLN